MVDFLTAALGRAPWLKGVATPLLFVIASVLAALPIFLFMAVNALVAVYAERKVSAFMQDRLGPMGQGVGLHAGKWGLLQTVADAIKLLIKEDTIPESADRKLFILAPFILFVGAFVTFVGVPFSEHLLAVDFNIGVFYVIAASSVGVLGIILAGYSSNNKWSLYGGMRSAAQIVSYEIPVGISLLAVVALAGSLRFADIVSAQIGTTLGILPNWYIFQTPFTFVAFFIFFISSLAETNRTPFDLPEAESELVAGFHTEYSGMRWAFFFLTEYANMFIVSAMATVLFLGGWGSPIPGLFEGPVWSVVWFMGKAAALILVMMWLRWTLPRLRTDQLMRMCWKFFLPISLVNLLGACAWELWRG